MDLYSKHPYYITQGKVGNVNMDVSKQKEVCELGSAQVSKFILKKSVPHILLVN